ncbi:lipoprotein [Streptomyces gobitricini]
MGRYGMRRGVTTAVAAGMVLTGCASKTPEAAPSAGPAGATAATQAGPEPVKGVALGGRGTPCPLPVTFETAPRWTAEAVTSEFGTLDQGPVTLACEIDAKPAGNIGFIRVWTGDAAGATPREVLEGFVGAEKDATKIRYRETKAGALPATEVTLTVSGEFTDGPKPERAFAVATPRGAVVVHLGGLDAEEHGAMLPAYELAKRTAALTD